MNSNTFNYDTDRIKCKLDKFISKNTIPHILFHGKSVEKNINYVNYLLEKIYTTRENQKSNILYVNCAYGKGIKYIREHLKFFAKTNISNNNNKSENYNTIKSIVLLNADFLTIDAQSALRRCIELYSHTTRFFVVVLDRDCIIKPILSRFCDIFVQHTEKIEYSTKLTKSFRNAKQRYITKILNNIDDEFEYNGKSIFELAEEMYNKGVFYYDFIEYINTHIKNERIKYSLITYINKIRIDIKNEKLLIFNILNIYCLRHTIEIENIYPF